MALRFLQGKRRVKAGRKSGIRDYDGEGGDQAIERLVGDAARRLLDRLDERRRAALVVDLLAVADLPLVFAALSAIDAEEARLLRLHI